jgi:hypothetical protein
MSKEYLQKVHNKTRATEKQLFYIKILSNQAFAKRVELDYNCDYRRDNWTKSEAGAAIEMMKRKLSEKKGN